MKTLIVGVALVFANVAFAEVPPAEAAAGQKLTFSVGLLGGTNKVEAPRDSLSGAGVGFYGRAGLLSASDLGGELELSGGTMGFSSFWRVGALLDCRANDWFTLAVGLVLGGNNQPDSDTLDRTVHIRGSNALYVGATGRGDLHLGAHFTLGLAMDLGLALHAEQTATNSPYALGPVPGGLALGYYAMVGYNF